MSARVAQAFRPVAQAFRLRERFGGLAVALAEAVRPAILPAFAILAWLAIYLPEAGLGFIKDDFAWLVKAPLAASPWDAAWTASTGFFRPLVSLSFTANYALVGLSPLGYGLTNIALAAGCAIFIFLLARSWGLGKTGASVAAFIWLFTPHGMDMAVIWISGRAALLLVLFATAACWSAARGRILAAAVFLALALLSKDEAVVVPLLAVLSMIASGQARSKRHVAGWLALSIAMLAAYFWARSSAGAMTPWTAPAEYRFALGFSSLFTNALRYTNRLITFPLLLCAIAWLLTGAVSAPASRRIWLVALGWAAAAMLPTIAVPVRSSLYVLLPLVGTAMLAATLIEARLAAANTAAWRRAAVAALVILVAAVPLYRARQHEWSGAARLSSRVISEVPALFRDVPEGSRIFLRDRPGRITLESTFGTLMPEMLRVFAGKHYAIASSRETADYELTFQLSNLPTTPLLSLSPIPR